MNFRLGAVFAAALMIALQPAGALAGPADEEPDGPQPLTPIIGLQPLQLDFQGCIAIGSCVEKTFDLFNNVDDPESMLEITHISIAGPGYSISAGPALPVFIPGDGTRVTYTVRYCPETGEHTPGGVTILARIAANSPRHLALSGDANLPPSCDAGGPYSGIQGISLVFDGRESADHDIGGRIDTYHWDFGDGTTGSGDRPNHTYSAPGPYPVILTVTDNCAAASACSTVANIQPGNQPPICDAGGPYSGVEDLPINFDGRGSSDPDGIITTYQWAFGDGGSATGPTPSHTYTQPGIYAVTLRVSDDDQAISLCLDQVAVQANTPPICNHGGPYSGVPLAPVQFTGSGSRDPDGTIVSYAWTFGDGGTSSLPDPTHTYLTPNQYSVSLTVTDNRGAQRTCNTVASIQTIPPICHAGGPYVAVVGAPITFDGSQSVDPDGTIVAYRWEFGDGATATGPRPVHTYAITGNYTVRLCVTDNFFATQCCETSAQILPSGGEPLTPVIGVAPEVLNFGVCTPVGESTEHSIEVFNDVFDPSSILHVTSAIPSGPGITLVSGPSLPIDLPGDGTRATFTLRFTPPDPLPQTGQLTLIASGAANSPRAVPLEGRGNRPPHCDADGPYSGLAGEPIQFLGFNSNDPGGLVLFFHWAFGDGSTSLFTNPSHIYSTFGEYEVRLQLTDNCGDVVACSTLAVVEARPLCDHGGPYEGSPFIPVQFDGTGSNDPDGTIVSYVWDFGDGSTGTGPNPTHTYEQNGAFAVVLTVTDDDEHGGQCTTFATIGHVTPVEIAGFAAEPRPDRVEISWRIAAAIDHQGFELWRSKEGEAEAKIHDGLIQDEDGDRTYRYTDRAVHPGAHYAYTLVAIDVDGSQQRFGPIRAAIPFPDLALRLGQNPTRPPVAISADLPRSGKLRMRILDATGRVVREIAHSDLPSGSHRVDWDGRDQRGPTAPSGVYFVVMELGADLRREKLVLIH